ncbi:MAG TPA: M48 family metalloprotease [Solirubrobacteraceae bacterium]|jgi:STE24 endopeptidase|nr:M48 family metalloprotease [Solirubrobacteraceae bacterium]
MSDARRPRWLPALLATLAAAEAGARLLAPRTRTIKPARIEPRSYFTSAEIERGARFARGQLAVAFAGTAVDVGALALLVKRPPALPRLLARLGDGPAAAATAAAGLSVASTLAGLPLAMLARRRALGVGLVTQSWRDWAVDVGKQTALGAPLAAAGGGLVVALTRRYPRGWWAPVAAGSLGAVTLFAALGPVVLDPIFNRFTPLPPGDTRTDVLDLAAAAGVQVGEAYSVDASRRTTAANAYVTGLGPTKRVVLFDTLLDRYTRDEIRLVVAHELAHVRHRDVSRSLGYAAIVVPAAAFAVQRLSWALAPARRGGAGALPALTLATAMVATPIGVIASRLSRAIERRADTLSLELTDAPEAFISFERRIALQNVADLDPPRLVSSLLASHPPTAERIGAAVAFQAQAVRPRPDRRTPAGS